MKKIMLGLLLICNINFLIASSHPSPQVTRAVISDEPADFTYIENGKPSHLPNLIELVMLAIEEELTHCSFSNDGNRLCMFSFAANQKDLKYYREIIEKENSNENLDPASRLTFHPIAATHFAKGIITRNHGCITVNLWIEDLKGCIVAQKQISDSSINENHWVKIFYLSREAGASLCHQMCNSKSNGQICPKLDNTDELFCPYFTVKLTRVKEITDDYTNRGLKATQPARVLLKEVSKRVIFIDPKNGKIKNVPLNSANYSLRTGYRQAYDYKNCKVYLEALDKKEDKDSNRAVVRVASTTPNRRFNGKTRLVFDIMDVEPMIEIDWYRLLHSTPYFSKNGTYVKTNIVSKRLTEDPEWYEKIRYVVKKAGEMHIESKCNIENLKEFARGYWTDMPAYKLSYDYDMNIRPSTKPEIREAKLLLKNMKYSLKDRRLYKTLNSTKGIYEWIKSEKNKKNQEKLKKKMDKEMKLLTD